MKQNSTSRRSPGLRAFRLLSVPLLVMLGAGCGGDGPDCAKDNTCRSASTSSGGGEGGEGGQSGQGGQGGGPTSSCVPVEEDAPVDDSCGAFVSSSRGDDNNNGSKAAPYASISAAVASGASNVYLCAESFVEPVVLPSGVSLYGGLDCTTNWRSSDTKTELTAAADVIPLTIVAGSGKSRIEDMAVTAADAEQAGGSSIAILAHEASAVLTRSEVTASAGAAGEDAVAEPKDSASDGVDGTSGKWSILQQCMVAAASYVGGVGGTKTCGGVSVSGGDGGTGTATLGGGSGENGDGPAGVGTGGVGGDGPSLLGGTTCEVGAAGGAGGVGAPGEGASGSGRLDASGYQGVPGLAGAAGAHGKGGGGGGGDWACDEDLEHAGPSGGGAGSGGCGGHGGAGGGAGGASIAIASVDSDLTLTDSILVSAAGGAGGAGSAGQPGGSGGDPGDGVPIPGGSFSCHGGAGGDGGRGGPGGGGLGGHSLGIAYVGAAPQQTSVDFQIGAAGPGGDGGNGTVDADAGADGFADDVLAFSR
jgi:hypothetical protein